MKTLIKKFILVSFAIFLFTSLPVHAITGQDIVNSHSGESARGSLSADIIGQYDKGAAKAEIGKKDLRTAATELIKIFLTFLGGIFMVLVVISGYNLITAGGEEEKVEKAQKTIKGAVIGLAIILAAYTITNFVANSAKSVISGRTPGETPVDYSK